MLLIASSSQDLLARWKQGLYAIDALVEVTTPDLLKTCLARYTPRLLLLDIDFSGLGGASTVRMLWHLSHATRIAVLGEPMSDDAELSLFVAGARGYCRRDSDAETMQRLVRSMLAGELWIRRALIPRLLDELTAGNGRPAATPVAATWLNELTQREQQIAVMISKGGSNKQIARRLDITERTVKSHLTEIFRKLGICDRLKLALLISTGVDIGFDAPLPNLLKARDALPPHPTSLQAVPSETA